MFTFSQNYCIVTTFLCHLTFPCALKKFWKPVTSKLFTLAMAAALSRAGKLMVKGQFFSSSCSLHVGTQPSQCQK